jgi:hypothetical protein
MTGSAQQSHVQLARLIASRESLQGLTSLFRTLWGLCRFIFWQALRCSWASALSVSLTECRTVDVTTAGDLRLSYAICRWTRGTARALKQAPGCSRRPSCLTLMHVTTAIKGVRRVYLVSAHHAGAHTIDVFVQEGRGRGALHPVWQRQGCISAFEPLHKVCCVAVRAAIHLHCRQTTMERAMSG